ncbi:hypothetical protein FRB91_009173, partial [Serendipita sp. 411]
MNTNTNTLGKRSNIEGQDDSKVLKAPRITEPRVSSQGTSGKGKGKGKKRMPPLKERGKRGKNEL